MSYSKEKLGTTTMQNEFISSRAWRRFPFLDARHVAGLARFPKPGYRIAVPPLVTALCMFSR